MIGEFKSYASKRKQEEIDFTVFQHLNESVKIKDLFLEGAVASEQEIFDEGGCSKVVKEEALTPANIEALIDQIPETEDLSGEELAQFIKSDDEITLGDLDEIV